MALAHEPNQGSVQITNQAGMTVTVAGTWTWSDTNNYVGYAISWGDVTSGNDVGSYHIGDGTAATNVVLQPTSPDRGSSGTWGPVSHTYSSPGTRSICVVVYDLGEVKPFKTTGWHSLQAGGTGRNTDNTVDQVGNSAAFCTQLTISGPTPSPSGSSPSSSSSAFSSFQGSTAGPSAPATGSEDTPSNGGTPLLPILLLMASGMTSVLAFGRVKDR
jgi:hypothetical protein